MLTFHYCRCLGIGLDMVLFLEYQKLNVSLKYCAEAKCKLRSASLG
jgi:hypothetical protein